MRSSRPRTLGERAPIAGCMRGPRAQMPTSAFEFRSSNIGLSTSLCNGDLSLIPPIEKLRMSRLLVPFRPFEMNVSCSNHTMHEVNTLRRVRTSDVHIRIGWKLSSTLCVDPFLRRAKQSCLRVSFRHNLFKGSQRQSSSELIASN